MKWSWRLGTISGIETRVHATFVLLLAWVAVSTWMSAPSLLLVLGGLAFTIAVFGSVLLHELGHALTARRFGIGTRGITLLPIGGVAELDGAPQTPKQEMLVAAAGPAVNVILAAGLGVLTLLLGAFTSGALAALGTQFVGSLAVANLLLGAFNMLPAFPMDGGRVLRAWLERRSGRLEATETAVKIGKGFAVLFGIVGLMSNAVLLLIAPFIWIAGDRELKVVRHLEELRRMAGEFRTRSRAGPARRRARGPVVIYRPAESGSWH
jgi:Zn-dependent protease